MSDTNMDLLLFGARLDSPSRKFGKECIADGELLNKMFFIYLVFVYKSDLN